MCSSDLVLMLAISNGAFNDKDIHASLGKNNNIIIGIIAGVVLAVAFLFPLVVSTLTSILGLQSFLPQSLVDFGLLNNLYTVIVNPFLEEMFFGLMLPFALFRFTKNAPLTIILTMLIFGGWHTFTTGGNINSMIFSAIFRLIILVGNAKLKTWTFGWSYHTVFNLLYVVSGAV